MKMDKQTLIKHHFWILLGVFGLFALVLIILVPVIIGAEADEKLNAIVKINKDLDTSSQSPMTRGYIQAQDKEIGTLSERRETIWRDMYRRQGGILTFPADLATKLDSLNFGAEIDDRNRNLYRSEEVYFDTYKTMSEIIKPTDYAGGWEAVLRPVAWTKVMPSSEEVWLSLEDLCVRREILKILADANDTGSRFSAVKDAKGLPPSNLGAKFSKRWLSRDFQLDLVISEKAPGRYAFGGKLKNLSGRRLSIGEFEIDVRLTPDLSETEPAKAVHVNFPIDPVPADHETDLKVIEKPLNLNPVDMFSVELHHTLQTVPIKRLMQLVLGRNAGHRMADQKLEMAKFSAPPVDPNAPAPAASPAPGAPGFVPGTAAGGGGSSEKAATLNGISKS